MSPVAIHSNWNWHIINALRYPPPPSPQKSIMKCNMKVPVSVSLEIWLVLRGSQCPWDRQCYYPSALKPADRVHEEPMLRLQSALHWTYSDAVLHLLKYYGNFYLHDCDTSSQNCSGPPEISLWTCEPMILNVQRRSATPPEILRQLLLTRLWYVKPKLLRSSRDKPMLISC